MEYEWPLLFPTSITSSGLVNMQQKMNVTTLALHWFLILCWVCVSTIIIAIAVVQQGGWNIGMQLTSSDTLVFDYLHVHELPWWILLKLYFFFSFFLLLLTYFSFSFTYFPGIDSENSHQRSHTYKHLKTDSEWHRVTDSDYHSVRIN